jgi:hypothetical protein
MSHLYHYFKDAKYPILISEETCKLTPHTFMQNNTMWEEDSIKYFYHNIPVFATARKKDKLKTYE